MLNRQIARLAADFENGGGFSERMCRKRLLSQRALLLRDDPAEIRYARKRLVIPIKDRTAWGWTPVGDRMPGGDVDGELVLYPVVKLCDWQLRCL